MLRSHQMTAGQRRGNILIVTLLLLALFATIGLTIVYYTKDLAERQRINIEAQSNGASAFPDDGTAAFNIYLAQLIYGPTPANINSFIYGQDVMRAMYGGQIGSTTAWTGAGSIHETVAAAGGLDRARIVNFMEVMGIGATVQPETSNAGLYIPKNAPYTYPDLKDFYLASICPATGEVLVPSYQRLAAFGPLAPTNGNWTNPLQGMFLTPRPRPFDNGGTSSTFPYPPPNPDGSYTGDVQNLPGGFFATSAAGPFIAKNDSIWIDIGLPTMPLPNGKVVKPLIAPLIVDLDGLLNISVHGNVYSSITSAPPPNGGSGVGIGPWEVNLVRALPTDGLSLINARGVPKTQSGIVARSYNNYLYQASSTQQLPTYSSVPWNTGGGVAPGYLNLSGLSGNSFYATSPLYSPTATSPLLCGYDSTNSPVTTPAILYNPVEWPTVFGSNTQGLNSQGFPSDLQQLMSRYAATPYNYAYPQLNMGGSTVSALTIRGNPAMYPFPTPSLPTYPAPQPSAGNPSNYRLDPANLNRGLLTPYAFSLDRQGFNPNYPGASGGLTWTAGTSLTGGVLSGGAPSPYTPIAGSVPALGPMDLNRPLADYRSPAAITAGQPLSPTNMAVPLVPPPFGSVPIQQAVADRQQFAMSIFARLILASGAQGATFTTVSGVGENVTITAAPGTPLFYPLQALAQLAANIVDYIDADDISTAFVWNSSVPNDPFNANNFAAATIGNSVVFGVEKPRLLLNEAYGEIVNDPNDLTFNQKPPPGASTNPQVRFWLELINPTNTPYTNGVGPLGNGSVTVRYPTSGYSAYQIQIVRSDPGSAAGINVSDVLRNPANPANAGNVTGAIVGTAPDLTFNFSSADTLAATNPSLYSVQPSNGIANLAGSMLICAANVQQPPTGGPDFIFPNGNIAPANSVGPVNTTTTAPVQNVINALPPTAAAQAAGSTLTYNSSITLAAALPGGGANGVSPDLLQHVVLLQRLANPYMPGPSPTNPYITVDYMDYVPAADRILRANGTTTNRSPYSKANTTGFNPNPASLGKVQPYAGWTSTLPVAQFPSPTNGYATGTYPFSFPSSMVLAQKPTALTTQIPIPGSLAQAVQHTFGQYNSITPATPPLTATYTTNATTSSPGTVAALLGGETIMTPFDWITQLDRSLINQTELFQVSMGKPHELTLRSILPNPTTGTDVSKFGNMAGPMFTSTTTMLYRALDTLRIQPYGQMTALGGRVPGRININTIQDKRVWDALFDSQPWNTFTQNDVLTMWNSMIATRTGNMQTRLTASGSPLTDSYGVAAMTPVPGATVYDSGAGTDRPFLPFGVPTFSPGGIAYTYSASGLLTDTLARNGSIFSAASNTGVGVGAPSICSSNGFLVAHPYVQPEALRKIMNNTTTVSHTFAVWVTVGYFNVSGTSSMGLPQLGSEYYTSVPGDLRKKFFSVVDRSLVGLTPGTINQSLNQPFFSTIDGTTSLQAGTTTLPITTSGSGQISINGTFLPLPGPTPAGLGNTLAVGVGATQEVVTLQGQVAYTNNGVAAYTTYAIAGNGPGGGLQFPHWPGECVSNIVPGNPGPQAGFSVTGSIPTPYNYVVPYWSRLP